MMLPILKLIASKNMAEYPSENLNKQEIKAALENKAKETQAAAKETAFSYANHFILERFAALTSDILFVLNPAQEKVEYLNSAVKNILHLHEKEHTDIQNGFLDYFPDPDRKYLLNLPLQGSQPSNNLQPEIRIKNGMGEISYFSLQYQANESSPTGTVNSFLCLCKEINDIKAYKKELQLKQLQLQIALESANMGAWSYKASDRKFELDYHSEKILGEPSHQDTARINPFLPSIFQDDRASTLLAVNRMLRHKKRVSHEFRLEQKAAKEIRHIAIVGECLQDPETKNTEIRGVCSDISSNKQVEKQFSMSESFLEDSQRMAKIGSFDWDLELGEVVLTSQLRSLLEMEPEEKLSLKHFFHPPPLRSKKAGTANNKEPTQKWREF